MTATKPGKRRLILKGLALFFALMVIAILAFPLWFPRVLRAVLRGQGAEFTDYQAKGYAGFSLSGVRASRPGIEITVSRVDAASPLGWLARIAGGNPASPPLARVSDWRVEIASSTDSSADSGSMSEVLNEVEQTFRALTRWVPSTDATNGVIRVLDRSSRLPGLRWRPGTLDASVILEGSPEIIDVSLRLPGPGAMRFVARSDSLDFELRADVNQEGRAWGLSGDILWGANHARLSGTFGETGWLPEAAGLEATNLKVPAGLVGLEGYSTLEGSVAGAWRSNRCTFDLSARADPLRTNELIRPPLEIQVRGNADSQAVTLDALRVSAPWGYAELTNAWVLRGADGLMARPATLALNIDLSRLPMDEFEGILEGWVTLDLQQPRSPRATFDLGSTRLRIRDVIARQARAAGGLDWPQLELSQLGLELGEGLKFEAKGAANFDAQTLDALDWNLSGDVPKGLLPDDILAESIRASGSARGPWDHLDHTGRVEAEACKLPPFKPAGVSLSWKGVLTSASEAEAQGTSDTGVRILLEEVEAAWRANHSTLAVSGAGGIGRDVSVRIDRLSLEKSNAILYTNTQPFMITVAFGGPNTPPAAHDLAVEGLRLKGDERVFALDAGTTGPSQGRIRLRAEHLAAIEIEDFIEPPGFGIELRRLILEGQWTNAPADFVVDLEGSMEEPETGRIDLQLLARGTAGGLKIETLSLATGLAPVIQIEGSLPLVLDPAGGGSGARFDRAARIDLRARIAPTQEFRLSLPNGRSLAWSDASLELHATGNLDDLQADLRGHAAKVEWQAGDNEIPIPPVTDLGIAARYNDGVILLDSLSGRIEGQSAVVSGRLPWTPRQLEAWATSASLPDWREAAGRLELQQIDPTPFIRFLPPFLASRGELSLDLSLQPGLQLEGTLTLTNASTRPLGSLTPIRDIEAQIRIQGREAIIERFSGQIGGQPVRLSGGATIPWDAPMAYRLQLTGTNLPLARTPGLLLRSDVNVRLEGGDGVSQVLSGDIRLRDGLFLQNVTTVLRQGPERIPLQWPYFSITNEPFAQWALDLRVHGDRFLRVSTPMFVGVVSANFKLQGTLGAPTGEGDARLDSGRVLFPFGTLTVDQGYASMSASDSRGPELLVNASGRNYRYNVHLEVSGPLDEPTVMFTSTPPLSSSEILLMLSAGEVPHYERLFSTTDRAGRLATFVGKDLVKRFIGGEDTEDRLIINTGENITEDGRTSYSVEYRLTDRWSIVGEYDRFNALNAGLKWKIYQR